MAAQSWEMRLPSPFLSSLGPLIDCGMKLLVQIKKKRFLLLFFHIVLLRQQLQHGRCHPNKNSQRHSPKQKIRQRFRLEEFRLALRNANNTSYLSNSETRRGQTRTGCSSTNIRSAKPIVQPTIRSHKNTCNSRGRG